ncbi:MAG: hypothetical protein NDJ92_11200 [Thermoanaerobaculia bacterium]|nr:hypothetical protein [Thermoanaerobaculia bacterium]
MRLHLSPVVLVCSALAFASAAAPPDLQPTTSELPTARPTARIEAISQLYPKLAVHLIVTGSRFPHKTSGTMLRLRPADGTSTTGPGVELLSGNRAWTATRIEDFLSFNTIAGTKYKIGIVKASDFSPVEWKLISNEVEYLLMMNLDHATPSPVPMGTGEVTISTANALGPKGSKVVKFGGKTANVVSWETTGGGFRIEIPANVMRPGQHDVWIEENGKRISDKLPVKLLGPTIQ